MLCVRMTRSLLSDFCYEYTVTITRLFFAQNRFAINCFHQEMLTNEDYHLNHCCSNIILTKEQITMIA